MTIEGRQKQSTPIRSKRKQKMGSYGASNRQV